MKNQNSELSYCGIFQNSIVGMYRSTVEGRFKIVNSALVEMLGYDSKEDVLALDIPRDLYVDPTQRRELIEKYSPVGKVSGVELFLKRKDGKPIAVLMYSHAIYGENHKIVGYDGMILDMTEEKKAQAAQKRAEEQLRLQSQLLDSVQDAVIATDLDMQIVYFGKGAEKLYGYSASEVNGKPISSIINTGGKKNESARMRHVLEAGLWNGHCLQRRKDGSVFWVETHLSLVKDEQGNARGYIGIDRDITELKKRERALCESNERLQTFLKNSPANILIVSRGYKIQYANRLWPGLEMEKVIGQPCFKFLAPDQAEIMRRTLGRVFEKEEIAECEIFRGGKWYKNRIAPIKQNGKVTAAVVIANDITNHKKASQALEQAKEKYRELVENINDVFFTLDEAGKITYISPVIETISEYKPEEYIGRHFADFVCREDLPTLQESFNDVLVGNLHPTEYRIRSKSGKVRWVRSSSRPIMEDNQVKGLRGLLTDIHERKKAEEEHQKLQAQFQYTQKLESLGILAGGIAHDFNNLLTGILGNASLALMEMPQNASAKECLEDIEKAAQRAAELCRQMLAYSGRGQFIVEPVNLSEVVKEIANLLEVSISKKVSLKYNFAKELPAIEADSTQLRQVIMNLITNASDAIGDKTGAIKITTGTIECDRDFFNDTLLAENHEAGKYVFVEISDTGAGMAKEMQQKIFDPFFTTKFTGRGLGLAAVLGIVRGHKGAIKIDSEPGGGTIFKVFFPCSTAGIESPTSPAVVTESWRGEGTILVVDDENTVRKTSRRILEHIGFRVVTVTDGLEAVDYFQEHNRQIKAVLLDMTMPNLNGEETFRELRSIRKDIRVILMSGYNQQDAANRFSENGLAGFIHKPFKPEELIAKIREVMENERTELF